MPAILILLATSCRKENDLGMFKIESYLVNQTKETCNIKVYKKYKPYGIQSTRPDKLISEFTINSGQESYHLYNGFLNDLVYNGTYPFEGDSVVFRFGTLKQISFVCNPRYCDPDSSYNPLYPNNFSVISGNVKASKRKFYITEAMYAAAKDL